MRLASVASIRASFIRKFESLALLRQIMACAESRGVLRKFVEGILIIPPSIERCIVERCIGKAALGGCR
jgi:hypothetical protein